MKIAFFTDTFDPQVNGVTVFLNAVSRQLKKRGHEVYIFAPRIKGHTDLEDNIVRLPSLKVLSSEPEALVPVLVPSFAYKKMLSLDFDVVHAHGNGAFSLLGLQVAKIKRVPYILTFHNDHTKYTHYVLGGRLIKPKAVAQIMKMFANRCDGVTTPSYKMEKELRRYGFKKHIEVIPNFVEHEKFAIKKSNFLYKKLNISKNNQLLLSVGRLTREKNYEFLLKSFTEVLKVRRNVHLVIVGKGPDDKRLEAICQKLGIVANVHFCGQLPVSQIPSVYRSADLYVHPSVSEVHSMSILEAAASALPFVVAQDEAYRGVVVDGVNGAVVPLNTKNFAKKIVEVLKKEKIMKQYGTNSRKIVEKNFTADIIMDRLVNYYDLIKNNHEQKKRRMVSVRGKLPVSRSEMWKSIQKVENYPSYVKFMKRAKIDGPFRTGTTWTDFSTVAYMPLRVRHKILKINGRQKVVYLIRLPLGGEVIQTLSVNGGDSQVEVGLDATIYFKNRLLDYTLGPVLQRRTNEMFEGTINNMQIRLENRLSGIEESDLVHSYTDKIYQRRVWMPLGVSAMVIVILVYVFGFNLPTEIKAAPGKVRTRALQIKDKSFSSVKSHFEKIEDRVIRDRP